MERCDARLAVGCQTIVPGVERMRNGRVYAVDVNSDESATEVLVFEDGRPCVVDIGVARDLVDGEPAFSECSLLDASDSRLLSGMVRARRRRPARRSAERIVGNECGRTCGSGWWPG